MHFTLFSVALFIGASIRGVSAIFAVNSPQIVQCQSTEISWEPTQPPYSLIVAKADDMCGDPLVDIGYFQTTITNWVATIPAGTKVYLSVMDNDSQEAWSSVLTVGPSNDISCLSGSGSGSSSPNSPGGSPTGSTSSSSSSPSPSTDISPLGAANAGALSGSAITSRQASRPIITIAGLALVIALL